MQRWLKNITPDRRTLEKHWCLKPFASTVVDRGCWSFKRNGVIRAFSLGLLIAFVPPTPLLPLHLTLCVLLGLFFRLNIPVLFATVFVSNPLTWFPQIAGSIWVGAKILGLDLSPMLHELTRHNVWANINLLWGPLLLGALVLGVIASTLGYALARLAWRGWALHRLHRMRACSSLRGTLHQNSVD